MGNTFRSAEEILAEEAEEKANKARAAASVCWRVRTPESCLPRVVNLTSSQCFANLVLVCGPCSPHPFRELSLHLTHPPSSNRCFARLLDDRNDGRRRRHSVSLVRLAFLARAKK